jgi:surfeit locus 1 family protein
MTKDNGMTRLPFWPTAITVLAVALCIGLGIWQIQRLAWKEALLADIESGLSAPPRPLPAALSEPRAWSYVRVTVTGRFDHGRELHLYAANTGGRPGYHILTPLLREDGPAVLVDRGWVPPAAKDPAARAAGQVAGTVTLSGIARIPTGPGPLTPDPDIPGNQWFAVDLPAMAAVLEMPLAPILVEADDTPNPGGLPVGGQTRLDIPNNHLTYAITWFLLALSAAVIYVVYVRRRR